MITPILKTVPEEKLACETAFKNAPTSTFVWCCHHAVHIEVLDSLPCDRVAHIIKNKPATEWAARFRTFRPVRVCLPSPLVLLLLGVGLNSTKFDQLNTCYRKLADEWKRASDYFDKICNEYAVGARGWREEAVVNQEVKLQKLVAEVMAAKLGLIVPCGDYHIAKANLVKYSKEIEEELVRLHNQDWPDNMWHNGKVVGT